VHQNCIDPNNFGFYVNCTEYKWQDKNHTLYYMHINLCHIAYLHNIQNGYTRIRLQKIFCKPDTVIVKKMAEKNMSKNDVVFYYRINKIGFSTHSDVKNALDEKLAEVGKGLATNLGS